MQVQPLSTFKENFLCNELINWEVHRKYFGCMPKYECFKESTGVNKFHTRKTSDKLWFFSLEYLAFRYFLSLLFKRKQLKIFVVNNKI